MFSIKREMRHFHVLVFQLRQRNVQKRVTYKVLVLLIKPIAFLPSLVVVAVVDAKAL